MLDVPGAHASSPAPAAGDAGSDVACDPVRSPPRPADRVASLIEIVLCSGFPTQLTLMLLLGLAGLSPVAAGGGLSLRYVALLSLADTVVLLALIVGFLRLRGDRPRILFLGIRPVAREALLGLLLVPAVFVLVVALSLAIARYAPWLRTVPDNPFAAMLRDPRDLVIFAFVAIVAGGLREELQRAFVLDRFERHLGGAGLGLVVSSVAFGLGHVLQGWDATVLTGVLGLVWAAVYLWRRSVVAPVVCHAVFNLAELLNHGLLHR
jgi:membrane protease YdiL (CAAX protease family)